MCCVLEHNFNTMKIRLSYIAISLVAFFAFSCNVERSEKYQVLLAERDSLYTEAVAANQEGNTHKAVSEINAIQQTLQENRKKIDNLEKKLAEQGAQSKALNQTVSRLKKQLEEKDTYIGNLKKELQESREQIAELNNQVTNLSENIEELNANLDVMNVQNAAQQATIESQDTKLNTVWVCVATQQMLIDKGILSKGGLFQASEISKQGFDKSQFTQGDKRELTRIPLNTKKPKVMTNHPEDSYKVNDFGDGNLVLEILDKESFWSMSSYLVVSIK